MNPQISQFVADALSAVRGWWWKLLIVLVIISLPIWLLLYFIGERFHLLTASLFSASLFIYILFVACACSPTIAKREYYTRLLLLLGSFVIALLPASFTGTALHVTADEYNKALIQILSSGIVALTSATAGAAIGIAISQRIIK
jgi:hypothetical protein